MADVAVGEVVLLVRALIVRAVPRLATFGPRLRYVVFVLFTMFVARVASCGGAMGGDG